MSDNKYGEPWEVFIMDDIAILKKSDGVTFAYPIQVEEAKRAKRCVNACASMPDEDVEILQTTLRLYREAFKEDSAELAEAVTLIREHCHSHEFRNCGTESCGNCTICNSLAFLTRHKGE